MSKVIGAVTTGVVHPGIGAKIAEFTVEAVEKCGPMNHMLLLKHDAGGSGEMYAVAITTEEGLKHMDGGALSNLVTIASFSASRGNDMRGAVEALRKTADHLEARAEALGV